MNMQTKPPLDTGMIAIMRTKYDSFCVCWSSPNEQSKRLIDDRYTKNYYDAQEIQIKAWSGNGYNGAYKGCRMVDWTARPPFQYDEGSKASATASAGPKADPFFVASTLAGQPVPPREWLVPDLIPARTVTMLGGDGGTGKSLLALQLAVAVATGGDWLGRQVTEGRALVMSAEDDRDELHRRLDDIVRAERLGFDDLERLTVGSYAGEDALLATLDIKSGRLCETPLYADLDARLAAERPALVILDTLADLHSGNENDRAHARHFIGLLRGLAIRHNCAVLLLAHPSNAGMATGTGLSGSTAWNGSVRSRLYLERVVTEGHEPNTDARRLTTKKANYASTGGDIGLTWRNGVFVADPAETSLDKRAAGSKAERVFMALLRQFESEGRHVNHAGGTNYAPTLFSKHPKSEGVTKGAFRSAMDSLLDDGAIQVEPFGPPSRQSTRLVEVRSDD